MGQPEAELKDLTRNILDTTIALTLNLASPRGDVNSAPPIHWWTIGVLPKERGRQHGYDFETYATAKKDPATAEKIVG